MCKSYGYFYMSCVNVLWMFLLLFFLFVCLFVYCVFKIFFKNLNDKIYHLLCTDTVEQGNLSIERINTHHSLMPQYFHKRSGRFRRTAKCSTSCPR